MPLYATSRRTCRYSIKIFHTSRTHATERFLRKHYLISNNKQKHIISRDAGWCSGHDHSLSTGVYHRIGAGRERGCRRGLGSIPRPKTRTFCTFDLFLLACSIQRMIDALHVSIVSSYITYSTGLTA